MTEQIDLREGSDLRRKFDRHHLTSAAIVGHDGSVWTQSTTFPKLIFVYVQTDNEDIGKPVSDYFGITSDAPTVLGYTGNDDARKFVHEGEVTLANLKAFGQDFIEDKLKPFFKSDPIPETVNKNSVYMFFYKSYLGVQ
ncbi:unnamed protein product [Prunus brigantina]